MIIWMLDSLMMNLVPNIVDKLPFSRLLKSELVSISDHENSLSHQRHMYEHENHE